MIKILFIGCLFLVSSNAFAGLNKISEKQEVGQFISGFSAGVASFYYKNVAKEKPTSFGNYSESRAFDNVIEFLALLNVLVLAVKSCQDNKKSGA